MKVTTIWTSNEALNIEYSLKKVYGDLSEKVLHKKAVRELVEIKRMERMTEKNRTKK